MRQLFVIVLLATQLISLHFKSLLFVCETKYSFFDVVCFWSALVGRKPGPGPRRLLVEALCNAMSKNTTTSICSRTGESFPVVKALSSEWHQQIRSFPRSVKTMCTNYTFKHDAMQVGLNFGYY